MGINVKIKRETLFNLDHEICCGGVKFTEGIRKVDMPCDCHSEHSKPQMLSGLPLRAAPREFPLIFPRDASLTLSMTLRCEFPNAFWDGKSMLPFSTLTATNFREESGPLRMKPFSAE